MVIATGEFPNEVSYTLSSEVGGPHEVVRFRWLAPHDRRGARTESTGLDPPIGVMQDVAYPAHRFVIGVALAAAVTVDLVTQSGERIATAVHRSPQRPHAYFLQKIAVPTQLDRAEALDADGRVLAVWVADRDIERVWLDAPGD